MIKYIARVIDPDPELIQKGALSDFFKWLKNQKIVQFDVETNVTNSPTERILRTVQFGEFSPKKEDDEKVQWVLEWKVLPDKAKSMILDVLENPKIKKVAHNGAFEAMVVRNEGRYMEGLIDTMLREKIIFTGHKVEHGFYSLDELCRRRLDKYLSKEYQVRFGEEEKLTVGHIIYAAQDVAVLDSIYAQQEETLNKYYDVPEEKRTYLNYLPELENEAALAFADISYNGFTLDTDAWEDLKDLLDPEIEQTKKDLIDMIEGDDRLLNRAISMGEYFPEDTFNINWNSSAQRGALISEAFDDLENANKATLKKWLKDNIDDVNTKKYQLILSVFEGDHEELMNLMLEHGRDFLIEKGFLYPKGHFNLSWLSPKLSDLISAVVQVDDTKKETLEALEHPIGPKIVDMRGLNKLKDSYGIRFLDHVKRGKIHTSFNQILNTGRVSSFKPNMQQIPVTPYTGSKYRNCFKPEEGCSLVIADYTSQELVVIATISKEPVWLEALKRGEDLHSICADLVFKEKWKEAGEEDCAYAKSRKKCNCPGHKLLRDQIKSINFGLAYGMSVYKFAATYHLSVKEAQVIIDEYFDTFPNIKSSLDKLGFYGIKYGHIMTLAPYYRKRFFPDWQGVARMANHHIKGIKYNPVLGRIERASKNTPIQGASADMTKLALVILRKYILKNQLEDKVQLILQVHDEIVTNCSDDYAKQWSKVLSAAMAKAAKVIIPSGLLKAESEIVKEWK